VRDQSRRCFTGFQAIATRAARCDTRRMTAIRVLYVEDDERLAG
jgi:hypothetical protein